MRKKTLRALDSRAGRRYNESETYRQEGCPMQPIVLLYNLAGQRLKQIELLAACLGVRARLVPPGDYGRPLGSLCGLPSDGGGAQGLWNEFGEEMLVMAFFTPETMRRFLDSFRQAGLPSVRLKAVLTETNRSWNSCALRAELLKEEAAFRAAKKG